MILIPILSGLLYLAGGQWNKWFRWGMGVPIAIIAWNNWWSLLAIPAYYLATSAFPYGEKSWLNFLGEWGKFFVVGFVLGACSFILLPFGLALLQSILSGISFLVIKWLDDEDIIKNPWIELLRGMLGTLLYVFK